VVFKSSLGAKVTGDTISLKDDSGTIIDTFTFTSSMGAAGDGNSLQKTTAGGWVAAVPTPGTTNATTATPTNQGNNTSSTTQTQTTTSSSNDTTTAQQNVVATISTHYSYVPLSDFDATRDLQISAGRPRMAAVGNPIEFVADTNQDNGSTRYEWSFGDGTTESNKTARHIYEYPGEYAVVLHATSPSASAIARTTVKIVNPDIFVVDANTQYVEVYNNGAEEMNLYGWELDQGINTFMFPEDTIILPKQSVRFASTLTRLAPQTFADVTLAQSVVPGTLRVVARAPTALERQRLLPHASIAVASAAAPKVAPVAIKKALPQTAAVVLATEATTTLATSTASRGEAVKVTKSWMDTLRHFFGLK
jgi:hypothetical protein